MKCTICLQDSTQKTCPACAKKIEEQIADAKARGASQSKRHAFGKVLRQTYRNLKPASVESIPQEHLQMLRANGVTVRDALMLGIGHVMDMKKEGS